MAEENSKLSFKTEIFDLLKSGNVEEAAEKVHIRKMNPFDLKDIAEQAYSMLIKSNKTEAAIAITESFNLPIELRLEAISARFYSLGREKLYDDAITWANKYKMSQNEINKMSTGAYFDSLKSGKIESAIEIKNKYNVPEDLIIAQTREKFNVLLTNHSYLDVLILGKEFEISAKRALLAGVRAYTKLITNGEIGKMIEMEARYKVLSDPDIGSVDQNDLMAFIGVFNKSVAGSLIDRGDTEKLNKVLTALRVYEVSEDNIVMVKLIEFVATKASVRHNELMDEGKYEAAFSLVEDFKLLHEKINPDIKFSVIKQAEKTHNNLLEKGDFDSAKFILESYELFGKNKLANSVENVTGVAKKFILSALEKGEIEEANNAAKEYSIKKDIVKELTEKALSNLLTNGEYAKCFEIIKLTKFEVTDPDILGEASTRFHQVYEEGNMELASTIDFYFKLKEIRARKAALNHWQTLINADKFDEALEFSQLRKISKQSMEPTLKLIHKNLTDQGRTYEADALRQKYKISVSFFEWILQFFKRLFGKG